MIRSLAGEAENLQPASGVVSGPAHDVEQAVRRFAVRGDEREKPVEGFPGVSIQPLLGRSRILGVQKFQHRGRGFAGVDPDMQAGKEVTITGMLRNSAASESTLFWTLVVRDAQDVCFGGPAQCSN